MRYLRGFGRFWFDFIVGDDWRIAAGVVAALGLGALALRAGLPHALLAVLVAVAMIAVVMVSVLRARTG
jgi:ABC-type methionine transport system permease subunit